MGIRGLVRDLAQGVLHRFGYNLVPDALIYDWQKPTASAPKASVAPLPDGAHPYLKQDNPRLRELQKAYAGVAGPVTRPAVWTPDYVRADDLLSFRADNPYVWQLRGRDMNEMSYALAYYHIKARDSLRLLDRLDEDLAFGVHAFNVDGRLVSRDLLDSVAELSFLERNLAISQRGGMVVLDIGAGYGRLAYRSVSALPSIGRYACTDAVPVSTFLCEYYLRFRGLDQRASVIPLHEIQRWLHEQTVDLALNIHSFSECRVEAIAWWASLLRERGVPYLMVVPNRVSLDGTKMLTNAAEDFSKILTDFGYRLVAQEPKYSDPVVQKYGPNQAIHFLFSL